MASITPKQKRFAREYIIDYNQKQAAIRSGYAVSGASVQGYRMLTNVYVRSEINRLQEKRKHKIDVTEQEIVSELLKIVKANPTDFLEVKGDIVKFKDLDKLDTSAIQSISRSTGKTVKNEVKCYDKIRALELLARYKAMLTDRTELTGDEEMIEAIRKAHDKRKREEKKKENE